MNFVVMRGAKVLLIVSASRLLFVHCEIGASRVGKGANWGVQWRKPRGQLAFGSLARPTMSQPF
jgi:hypothetical protein